MAIDMKENSKIVNSTVKVHIGSINIHILYNSSLCIQKIGKFFCKNGWKYEGEFKDDFING